MNVINPLFFAWPSTILSALSEIIVSGDLIHHVSVSFFELFCGYGLACTAIPLGLILGRSKTLEYIFDPLISALNAIPRVAMMPLIILMLGIGINSKIFLIFFGCFFPILVNVFQGTKHIDPLTIDMAKVFGEEWDRENSIEEIPDCSPAGEPHQIPY